MLALSALMDKHVTLRMRLVGAPAFAFWLHLHPHYSLPSSEGSLEHTLAPVKSVINVREAALTE